jgi:hypothetical protein
MFWYFCRLLADKSTITDLDVSGCPGYVHMFPLLVSVNLSSSCQKKFNSGIFDKKYSKASKFLQ